MKGDETIPVQDVLPEIVAALVVGMFVGVAMWQWVMNDAGPIMLFVLGVTVLAAVATIFGVDKLEAAVKAWRGNQ